MDKYVGKDLVSLRRSIKKADGPRIATSRIKALAYLAAHEEGNDISLRGGFSAMVPFKPAVMTADPLPIVYCNLETPIFSIPKEIFKARILPYMNSEAMLALSMSCKRFLPFFDYAVQSRYLKSTIDFLRPHEAISKGRHLNDALKILTDGGLSLPLADRITVLAGMEPSAERFKMYIDLMNGVRQHGSYTAFTNWTRLKESYNRNLEKIIQDRIDEFTNVMYQEGFRLASNDLEQAWMVPAILDKLNERPRVRFMSASMIESDSALLYLPSNMKDYFLAVTDKFDYTNFKSTLLEFNILNKDQPRYKIKYILLWNGKHGPGGRKRDRTVGEDDPLAQKYIKMWSCAGCALDLCGGH
tara:strand:- start:40253 stop:41323 length:1071 start_codon:yes stop_codon:yes gene_type:complete